MSTQPTGAGFQVTMAVRRKDKFYNVNCAYNSSSQIAQIYNAPSNNEGIKKACHKKGNEQGLSVYGINEPRQTADGYSLRMTVGRQGKTYAVSCLYNNSGLVTIRR
ncbi:hypothetical protein [Chlorogloeopsis sp. ULAP02]|uniref:hypothetical protein n=1 Tax=Chlorogloeopsis sp. ULAP02 TaxID=3107926 RepID=UPI003134C4B3